MATALLCAAPAAASTYVVNNNADFSDATPGNDVCGVPASSGCSLRAAIEESNAHAGPDTVQLPADTYLMGGAEPEVDSEVTILGAGRFVTTLARGAPGRVLSVGPSGVLDLRDVKVTDGVLADEGAGILSTGELTIRRSSVTGNNAVASNGGGILITSSAGATLIEDSTVSLNEAGDPGLAGLRVGGGIWQQSGAGKLTIRGSTIAANRVDGASAEGGGIYATGDLEVVDSTIEENTVKADSTAGFQNATGSAIVAAVESTILRAEIIDNVADEANMGRATSALFFSGPTTITDSTVAGNEVAATATTHQLMLVNGSGPLEIRGSTFSDNYGGIDTTVDSTIENSTFTGSPGAALTTFLTNSLTIRASTISDSGNAGVQAGVNGTANSAVTVTGSIISGNLFNCYTFGSSTITSGGGNVEDYDDCGFAAANDLINTDPLLAPLAANGGLTKTRALPANSPAVDNFAAGCPPPASDQRGKARPQGGACDSGAYEFDTPAAVTIDTGPSGTTADPTPVFTFSANEPVSGAECRLLGAGTTFVACSSPVSYGPLADGDYTFQVRVIDSDGNPSPIASRPFTVDAPDPAPAPDGEPSTPGPGAPDPTPAPDGKPSPPGPGAPADTEVTDPDVSLDKKIFVKNKELKVKVSAGAQEDVTVRGKGSVVVKPKKKGGKGRDGNKNRRAKAKTIELRPVTKKVEAGERTILRLKYKGGKKKRQRMTRQLKRQIRQGKKVRARVQVTLTDGAGNSVTEKRVARLKVKKGKGRSR